MATNDDDLPTNQRRDFNKDNLKPWFQINLAINLNPMMAGDILDALGQVPSVHIKGHVYAFMKILENYVGEVEDDEV